MSEENQPHVELILERALLGAIAALLPVPFLDEALLRRSRRILLTELARRSDLHLDGPILTVLATDPGQSPLARLGFGLLARSLRRATLPLRVLDRARAAIVTFQLATLLDHYAREHHRGLDLDEPQARRLRAVFDEAIRATPFSRAAVRHPAAHGAALRQQFDLLWAQRALT